MARFSNCLMLIFITATISLVFCLVRVPPNPCPNVFQYYQEPSSDNIFGQITIPYDRSSTLNLGVNVSMMGYYTDNTKVNLKIELKTPSQDIIDGKANTLSYNVYFPFQESIPRITNIEFNQKTLCTGPAESLYAGGPGVTSLWAGHRYFFQNNRQGGPGNEYPVVVGGQPTSPSDRYPETFFTPRPVDNLISVDKPSIVVIEPQSVVNSVAVNKPEPVENPNRNQQCGISRIPIVPLILGGDEISEGMFPWLAAMFVAKGIAYEYKCTGNLVSDRHVITAARCLQFYKVQIISTDDILFVFGRSSIAKWATNGAVTRGATKVQTHPEYDQKTAHADISIVTLDRPLTFSKTIVPICLWEGNDDLNDIVNKKGTVAGWGVDQGAQKSGKSAIPLAKYLDMPVVTQENCLYSNLTYYTLTSEMTFCAGNRDGNGPCVGDSGAGFMINKEGKYYLRGLASLVLNDDKGKCDLSNFVIFCDVAKVMEWIKKCMQ